MRNHYGVAPGVPVGFSSGRISGFSECADGVFPVGQASGLSNITQHDEFFPVTVDVLVSKGCDGLLAKLALDLGSGGWYCGCSESRTDYICMVAIS